MERILVALSLILLFASTWGVGARLPESRGLPTPPLPTVPSEGENVGRLGEAPWGDDQADEGEPSVSDVGTRGDGTRGWESERSLVEEAQVVLGGYRQRGDCVLAHAGYVDLLGRAWSCVIQGDGWVDICVVQETGEGGSRVSVSRIESAMWEEGLNAEGTYG